jgi:hypothetical protein
MRITVEACFPLWQRTKQALITIPRLEAVTGSTSSEVGNGRSSEAVPRQLGKNPRDEQSAAVKPIWGAIRVQPPISVVQSDPSRSTSESNR